MATSHRLNLEFKSHNSQLWRPLKYFDIYEISAIVTLNKPTTATVIPNSRLGIFPKISARPLLELRGWRNACIEQSPRICSRNTPWTLVYPLENATSLYSRGRIEVGHLMWQFPWKVVLLSQDLVYPFSLVRFAGTFSAKRSLQT